MVYYGVKKTNLNLYKITNFIIYGDFIGKYRIKSKSNYRKNWCSRNWIMFAEKKVITCKREDTYLLK